MMIDKCFSCNVFIVSETPGYTFCLHISAHLAAFEQSVMPCKRSGMRVDCKLCFHILFGLATLRSRTALLVK